MGLRLLAFIAIAVIISGCGAPQILSSLGGKSEPESRQTELAPGQLLTLDGLDSGTGLLVLRIPLRKEPAGSATAITATSNHGELVKFVQRDAENVLVETKDGKRGWVSTRFVKELK
jgi:hypothetical protein